MDRLLYRKITTSTINRAVKLAHRLIFSAALISFVGLVPVCSQETALEDSASSYSSIDWLIGKWELNIPQGLVKMTFEWGANKSYIKYVGFNPGGGIEHEGIIIWHPVRNKIIELSAFTSVKNKGTPSEAYFEVLGKGKLVHYFTLFYPQFDYVKDGRVIRRKPRKVEYRQIWTRRGENGLHDVFQTRKNGKWQLVDKKDKAGFKWQKVDK